MGAAARAVLAVALFGASACELQEVTLAEPPVDAVVVEGLVQVGIEPKAPGGSDRIAVFLHRTVQGAEGLAEPVPDALVEVSSSSGGVYSLGEQWAAEACVTSTPEQGTGTCYLLQLSGPASGPSIEPGDTLRLTVTVPDGRVLRGVAVVPGDFDLVGLTKVSACEIPPETVVPLVWTSSRGAWAYLSETGIVGLPEALAPRGIEVDEDPLFLTGVSASATDTTITFPAEFGVFDRFDLDRELALVLQEGLPEGTEARVAVAAVDRNYVNWVRGGNFNPSGAVRVPSITGEGTGYFGAAVVRWVELRSDADPGAGPGSVPACPGYGPAG